MFQVYPLNTISGNFYIAGAYTHKYIHMLPKCQVGAP